VKYLESGCSTSTTRDLSLIRMCLESGSIDVLPVL
jgi:hypothetical protein